MTQERRLSIGLFSLALGLGLMWLPFGDPNSARFAVVLLICAWLAWASRCPWQFGLADALMALLVLAVLPSAWISRSWGEALQLPARVLSLWVFYKVFSALIKQNGASTLVKTFSWCLVVLVIWGTIQWLPTLYDGVISHQETYRVTGSLHHRNLFIAFLMVLLPVVFAFDSKQMWLRRMAMLIAISMGIMLLNRTSWLILGMYAVIGGVVFIPSLGRSTLYKLSGVFVGAGLLLFLMVDEWFTISHHLDTATTKVGTTADRLHLALQSWHMMLQHPWTGIGAGMFKVDFFLWDQQLMTTSNGLNSYARPHNDYLWLGAEAGVAAFLAYALLHLVGTWKALKKWLHTRDVKDGALLLAWMAFVLASLSSYPIERIESIALLALLLSLSFNDSAVLGMHRRATGLLIILALVLASFFATRSVGEFHAYKAPFAKSEALYKHHVKQAQFFGVGYDFHHVPLGPRLFEWNRSEYCASYLATGQELSPEHPKIRLMEGRCALLEGDTSAAMKAFQASVKTCRTFQDGWVALAALEYESCQRRRAFNHFVQADVVQTNAMYDQLGAELAIDSLSQLADQVEDRKMKLTLEAMRNTPEWALLVIKNVGLNSLGFKEQAYLDALYYMWDHCDEYEDCELVEELVNKYLPHRKTELIERLNER
jgi:hypothetical protein